MKRRVIKAATMARQKSRQRRFLRSRANPRAPRTSTNPAGKRSLKTRAKANTDSIEDSESGGGEEGSTVDSARAEDDDEPGEK